MSNKDSLGDRMKDYEQVSRTNLIRRTPVIVRVDGKAFHTLTRGMTRPWDEAFTQCMWDTAKALCREIQGAQLAYVQSDEISVLIVDYQTLNTDAWFDNQVQKIVSISAAIATSAFSVSFQEHFSDKWNKGDRPLFDARVFNLPREEVTNYFVWRQQDATRNSIQSAGQAHFSHKELHNVTCDGIQDKLFKEKNINWNDYAPWQKRGTTIVKEAYYAGPDEPNRSFWCEDFNVPVFTQDRAYIEKFVYPTTE